MGALDKLEVISGGERQTGYDSVRIRRKALAESLADQSKMLDEIDDGGSDRTRKAPPREPAKASA